MSSLAKTNKAFQRLHRERHQPESRKRFGYLEKKKDYKTRALDHQKKVKTITKLKEKAANKNPNEFVFHMINSGLVNGRHFEKRKNNENVKEVVSKNIKYLNWKRGIELKKIDKLQSELHFINSNEQPVNKKIIFKEQGPKKKLKAIEVQNTRRRTEKSISKPEQSASSSSTTNQQPISNIKLKTNLINKIAKEKTLSYTNLMKRLEREKKLRDLIVKSDFSLKKQTKNGANPKRFADEDDEDALDKQLIKKIRK